MDEVADKFPELLPWVNTCYGTTSNLLYGSASIPSSTGAQQGDALGPLLFSLTQQPVEDQFPRSSSQKLQTYSCKIRF